MRLTVTDILIIIVIFQLLFISFFLFTYDKGKRISLWLLGAFFLSFCLNLIDGFLLLSGVYFDYPSFALWASSMPLLYGPLLYLYARSVLYSDFAMRLLGFLHFLPFVLLTCLSIAGYNLQTGEEKMRMLRAVIDRTIPDYIYVAGVVIFLHFFGYMFFSLRIIRQYQYAASNKFSDADRTNLFWMRSTFLFFIVFMLLGTVNGFAGASPGAKYYYLFLTILLTVFFLFMNKLMLKVLRVPGIFSILTEEEARETQSKTAKYTGSLIQEDEKNRITEKLIELMKNEKPYLDAELSLNQLAARLSVKPKILSQVINEKLGQNFFDFINTYRIEEAKRIFRETDDPKTTVLEVLYEVGFNSKSSFNTLFKKNTGLTPSEFKKKYQPAKRSASGRT